MAKNFTDDNTMSFFQKLSRTDITIGADGEVILADHELSRSIHESIANLSPNIERELQRKHCNNGCPCNSKGWIKTDENQEDDSREIVTKALDL